MSYEFPFQKPEHQLKGSYRVDLISSFEGIGEREVVEMWTAEGVLGAAEAERRAGEVCTAALDTSGRLCGVCTVYPQANRQLGAQLWFARVFVASEHRLSNLAVHLLWQARRHYDERFVRGEEPQLPGMVIEVEYLALEHRFPHGTWITGWSFIGHGENGSHVRVHWFEGARVPPPTGA